MTTSQFAHIKKAGFVRGAIPSSWIRECKKSNRYQFICETDSWGDYRWVVKTDDWQPCFATLTEAVAYCLVNETAWSPAAEVAK